MYGVNNKRFGITEGKHVRGDKMEGWVDILVLGCNFEGYGALSRSGIGLIKGLDLGDHLNRRYSFHYEPDAQIDTRKATK